MEYYIAGAALWILAAVYLIWRIRRSMKCLMSPPPELTWLIYLVIFTVCAPLISAASHWSRGAAIALLAAAFVISFALSYWALGRYRKWLAEQQKKKEEDL